MKFCWKNWVFSKRQKETDHKFSSTTLISISRGIMFHKYILGMIESPKLTAKKVYNRLRIFFFGCFKHTKLSTSFSTTLIGNQEGSCFQKKYILGMHNKLLQNNCKSKNLFEKTCLRRQKKLMFAKKENLLPPLLTHGQTNNLGSCFMNV
jgi:hypothetical protein